MECPSCAKEFCSKCSGSWHAGKTCQQYGEELVKRSKSGANFGGSGIGVAPGQGGGAGMEFLNLERFDGDIKPCPMCRVLIERDDGCAQMMCKRCKHVFCWFCQTSLDVSLEFFYFVPEN